MRKIIILLVVLFAGISQAQFVQKNGNLRVDGTQLVNQNGEPTVLRGMSLGWHVWWPRFYNEDVVQWLKKDWNITVIRAAMGVHSGDGNYLEDPKGSKELMKKVIDAALKNDIYVIVDWHSHDIYLEEAKLFFDEISKQYGKYPNVIYEIFNEPDEETWPEVKAYAEEVIQTIRKNDPDNIILVGTPKWDQDVHIAADDPIKNQINLMYTMHFYAASHDKWLRDNVDYALRKNLPVFVSESAGVEATGDGPLKLEAWDAYIQWMEKNKLSWITWSVTDKDESCSVVYPSASSKGNWKEEDLKSSGKKARDYFRNLNVQ